MSALTDLKEYGLALREKEIMEQQMERLGITGAPSGARGVSNRPPGTNDRTAAAMQQLDGLEALLKQQYEEVQRKALAGERALAMIRSSKARVVMRSYYVLRMSDDRIAEMLKLGKTTVWRIRTATESDLDRMA